MKKEFISYKQALALKELGFDEPCFSDYINGILQPSLNPKDYSYFNEMSEINPIKNFEIVLAQLYQQAFRWFRKNYNLIGQPIPLSKSYPGRVTHYGWAIVSDQNIDEYENDNEGFNYYEEAELECLEKLIEIVTKKQAEAKELCKQETLEEEKDSVFSQLEVGKEYEKEVFEIGEETLEEAALEYAKNDNTKSYDFTTSTLTEAFEAGVIWSVKKRYSEEEVYNILEQGMKDAPIEGLTHHCNGDFRNLKEWFEQFKKR